MHCISKSILTQHTYVTLLNPATLHVSFSLGEIRSLACACIKQEHPDPLNVKFRSAKQMFFFLFPFFQKHVGVLKTSSSHLNLRDAEYLLAACK